MRLKKSSFLPFALLTTAALAFFPVLGKVTVPPSRPKRNSVSRRLSGNLLGKISSVNAVPAEIIETEDVGPATAEEAELDIGPLVFVWEYKLGKLDSKDKMKLCIQASRQGFEGKKQGKNLLKT